MPKNTINYQNTIIYKIVCDDLNITDSYVGHTTNFVKRKQQHKESCNNVNSKSYNRKVYKIIRDNGGWNNWNMIEIEKYKCNDANEARSKERYWYEELNSKLNSCYPGRKEQEYQKLYNEKNEEKLKEYRVINKEKKVNYDKQYREQNEEKIKNTALIIELKNKNIIRCIGKLNILANVVVHSLKLINLSMLNLKNIYNT